MGLQRDNVGKSATDRKFAISDATFCAYLKRLNDLHAFLYQEAVPVNPSAGIVLEMGNLSALYYHIEGRVPTIEEWNQVEKQTQTIFLLLTPALRRKFLMGGTPWIVAWLPVYFLGIAALSLIFAVVAIDLGWRIFWVLLVYLVWLATLGAVGALAFIGMNALSIQDDITFDFTNKRLMLLRIALGALFAVVLTLPFGFPEFLSFCSGIAKPIADGQTAVMTRQAVFLLLPFILGFSTSLVILILNQLIEAVQAFFGRKAGAVTSPLLSQRVATGHDEVTFEVQQGAPQTNNASASTFPAATAVSISSTVPKSNPPATTKPAISQGVTKVDNRP